MPTPNGIPKPHGHRAPKAGSPADRTTAVKPAKGRTPRQPDYDTTNLRQPLSAGSKRMSSKR